MRRRTRFAWITDMLPDALGDYIAAMRSQGAAVMQRTPSTPAA